jgi:N-acetylmuramoyl-L-alanine amidase
MKIVMSSGHSKHVRGASGYLDEVDEARKVVDQVAALLRVRGTEITVFHDNTSNTQSENLDTIISFHNSKARDLDVSVHLNAYETTSKPMGTECLFVTQSEMAERMSGAIAEAGGFIDRGAKRRGDLAFLSDTEEPAIMIELCFVDSQEDANLYRGHFADICEAIADTLEEAKVV